SHVVWGEAPRGLGRGATWFGERIIMATSCHRKDFAHWTFKKTVKKTTHTTPCVRRHVSKLWRSHHGPVSHANQATRPPADRTATAQYPADGDRDLALPDSYPRQARTRRDCHQADERAGGTRPPVGSLLQRTLWPPAPARLQTGYHCHQPDPRCLAAPA